MVGLNCGGLLSPELLDQAEELGVVSKMTQIPTPKQGVEYICEYLTFVAREGFICMPGRLLEQAESWRTAFFE